MTSTVAAGPVKPGQHDDLGAGGEGAYPFGDLGLEDEPGVRCALVALPRRLRPVLQQRLDPSDRHDLIAACAPSPPMPAPSRLAAIAGPRSSLKNAVRPAPAGLPRVGVGPRPVWRPPCGAGGDRRTVHPLQHPEDSVRELEPQDDQGRDHPVGEWQCVIRSCPPRPAVGHARPRRSRSHDSCCGPATDRLVPRSSQRGVPLRSRSGQDETGRHDR